MGNKINAAEQRMPMAHERVVYVPFSNVFDFEVLFPETDKKRRIRIIRNKCMACAARNVTIATCTGGNNNDNGVCGNFAT